MNDDQARRESLLQRQERMGISERDLAKQAGVSRGAVKRALSGETVRGSTIGVLEATMDRLEHVTSLDEPDPITTTIELPDGVKVTFAGTDANRVAETVTKFLANRPPLSD